MAFNALLAVAVLGSTSLVSCKDTAAIHEVYTWGKNNAGQVRCVVYCAFLQSCMKCVASTQEPQRKKLFVPHNMLPADAPAFFHACLCKLGLVNFQERNKPALVSLLKGKRVDSVVAGANFRLPCSQLSGD